MGVKVICVDTQDLLLKALRGAKDPEQKSKIIGNLFIDIFEKEASKLGDASFLAQNHQ
ncbi:MAG: hypothetical protein MI756_07285 [Chromatiales bacterium]|nr:hypothetical protein [Chromatiales bacterium]